MRCIASALVAAALLVAATSAAGAGLVPGIGVVRIYYKSSWAAPRIHYNPDASGWTPSPGVFMKPSDNATYPGWWMETVAANQLTFVLNDGGSQWDNNKGQNYNAATPGVFTLVGFSNALQTVQTFDKGCPLACSGHGTCGAANKCTCSTGWSGPACSCSPDTCGAHGACDAQGECSCVAPWASCGAVACGSDVSADNANCGGCGKVCKAPEFADGAKCANSKCNIQCRSGYVLCSDELGVQSCVKGDKCPLPPLPGCQVYTDDRCVGRETEVDIKYANHTWFTPRPGDKDYQASFGDMWRLVGHVHMTYDAPHTTATVQVKATHKDNARLQYEFDGVLQDSDTKSFTGSFTKPLTVRIVAADGAQLKLQDVDFVWNAPAIPNKGGDYRGGQKGGIVELFGWPHKDIEEECEFMSKAGWLGVKVFPMQEQVMSLQPFNDIMNPWYFMYQPVSYRFEGRMGTHEDLRNMIYTCRKFGVRVYADAVINHMVGGGNDINPHHRNLNGGNCVYWPNKNSSATEMSPFFTQGFTYTVNEHTGKNPLQEFPAVPYGPLDFHCERPCDSWADGVILDGGWLTGLTDLNTAHENVRERIADYLTSVLSIGFSGFRVDAAKHIRPDDLVAIFSKLRRNMGGELPGDFITWLEVLLGGEANLLICNPDSGYNYGGELERKLLAAGFSQADANKVKIWFTGYPGEPGQDCGAISQVREAIQNDDADQQNPGSTSRDMHDQGAVFIKTRDVNSHRNFEMRLFTNPNGVKDNDNSWPIRLVLSSYFWGENGAGMGVPDGLSDCKLCAYTCQSCHGMPYSKAHDPNSCGYDLQVYTRTHRDKAVINAMRSWMKLGPTNSNEELGLPAHC